MWFRRMAVAKVAKTFGRSSSDRNSWRVSLRENCLAGGAARLLENCLAGGAARLRVLSLGYGGGSAGKLDAEDFGAGVAGVDDAD